MLATCPRAVYSTGELSEWAVMVMPDGSRWVSMDSAIDREGNVLGAVFGFKRAWQGCKSVVEYVEQRDSELAD